MMNWLILQWRHRNTLRCGTHPKVGVCLVAHFQSHGCLYSPNVMFSPDSRLSFLMLASQTSLCPQILSLPTSSFLDWMKFLDIACGLRHKCPVALSGFQTLSNFHGLGWNLDQAILLEWEGVLTDSSFLSIVSASSVSGSTLQCQLLHPDGDKCHLSPLTEPWTLQACRLCGQDLCYCTKASNLKLQKKGAKGQNGSHDEVTEHLKAKSSNLKLDCRKMEPTEGHWVGKNQHGFSFQMPLAYRCHSRARKNGAPPTQVRA